MELYDSPSLTELLDDPIVIAMMTRDGFSRESVLALIDRVRRNLEARRRDELLAA